MLRRGRARERGHPPVAAQGDRRRHGRRRRRTHGRHAGRLRGRPGLVRRRARRPVAARRLRRPLRRGPARRPRLRRLAPQHRHPRGVDLRAGPDVRPAPGAVRAPAGLERRAAGVRAGGRDDLSPNRSHFAAMDEMERAAPGSAARTGWLDRTLALHALGGPFARRPDGVDVDPGVASPDRCPCSAWTRSRASACPAPTRRPRGRAGPPRSTRCTRWHRPGCRTRASGTLGALDTAAAISATAYVPGQRRLLPRRRPRPGARRTPRS